MPSPDPAEHQALMEAVREKMAANAKRTPGHAPLVVRQPRAKRISTPGYNREPSYPQGELPRPDTDIPELVPEPSDGPLLEPVALPEPRRAESRVGLWMLAFGVFAFVGAAGLFAMAALTFLGAVAIQLF